MPLWTRRTNYSPWKNIGMTCRLSLPKSNLAAIPAVLSTDYRLVSFSYHPLSRSRNTVSPFPPAVPQVILTEHSKISRIVLRILEILLCAPCEPRIERTRDYNRKITNTEISNSYALFTNLQLIIKSFNLDKERMNS